jgi:hypothetical protein
MVVLRYGEVVQALRGNRYKMSTGKGKTIYLVFGINLLLDYYQLIFCKTYFIRTEHMRNNCDKCKDTLIRT